MHCDGVLGRQSFAGSDLVRGIQSSIPNEHGSFGDNKHVVLVFERKINVARERSKSRYVISWLQPNDLSHYGSSPSFVVGGTQDFLYFHSTSTTASPPIELPLYYLGCTKEESSHDKGIQNTGDSYYVCDIGNLKNTNPDLFQNFITNSSHTFIDLRALLPQLPFEDLSYVGHAVALAQWHQNHQFCSKCGSKTASIAGGSKRQCLENPSHKHYPRTDPVIITLLVLDKPLTTSKTPDSSMKPKEKALLGRSKTLPPGTLTCLSGFIDQGESIEEAVAREVKEESGLIVHSVEILGSQPWPIGRGGSCELMIGCVAKTSSEDLKIDYNEMAECRWVEKEEVLAALKRSLNPESPFLSGGAAVGKSAGRGTEEDIFFVPPPYAIAHHLLKYWAENQGEPPPQVTLPSVPQSNM